MKGYKAGLIDHIAMEEDMPNQTSTVNALDKLTKPKKGY
jgi:hypothetical protein